MTEDEIFEVCLKKLSPSTEVVHYLLRKVRIKRDLASNSLFKAVIMTYLTTYKNATIGEAYDEVNAFSNEQAMQALTVFAKHETSSKYDEVYSSNDLALSVAAKSEDR